MIVCMTRQIAVDLYSKIISLRPEWHNEKLDA
jgi:type I restriction enzyme, R subunit